MRERQSVREREINGHLLCLCECRRRTGATQLRPRIDQPIKALHARGHILSLTNHMRPSSKQKKHLHATPPPLATAHLLLLLCLPCFCSCEGRTSTCQRFTCQLPGQQRCHLLPLPLLLLFLLLPSSSSSSHHLIILFLFSSSLGLPHPSSSPPSGLPSSPSSPSCPPIPPFISSSPFSPPALWVQPHMARCHDGTKGERTDSGLHLPARWPLLSISSHTWCFGQCDSQYVCLPDSMSVCLTHSMSVCLPVCLIACLPVCHPVCLPASLSVTCQSCCISACLAVCLPPNC